MPQDYFGLPKKTVSHRSLFTGAGGQWQAWNKPRGVNMLWFFAVSAGGGAGGGHTQGTGSNRGGGGGGGSAGSTRLIIPAVYVPDLLWIQVGLGGAGGAATVNGSAGGVTYVSLQPVTNTNLLLINAGGGGGGGSKGTNGGGGGAGGTGGAGNATASLMSLLGIVTFNTSNAGATGGGFGTGNNVTLLANQAFTCGGAGGGGATSGDVSAAGGQVTGNGTFPNLPAGTSGGGEGPGLYYAGSGLFLPGFGIPYGGAGGGGNGSGTAGKGGDGAVGCGGGGGGGGVTGGAGGNGGNGMVLIVAW